MHVQVPSLVLQRHHLLGFAGQGLEPPQAFSRRLLGLLGRGVSQQLVQVVGQVVRLWTTKSERGRGNASEETEKQSEAKQNYLISQTISCYFPPPHTHTLYTDADNLQMFLANRGLEVKRDRQMMTKASMTSLFHQLFHSRVTSTIWKE